MSDGWTQVDNAIVRSATLTVYEKAVYAVIKSHMNGGGAAWPSLPTIAAEANCSRMQVFRAVNGLVNVGLLAKVSRGNGAVNTYITSTPQLLPREEPVPDSYHTSTPQLLGSTPQLPQPVPDSYPKKTKGRRTIKKTKEEDVQPSKVGLPLSWDRLADGVKEYLLGRYDLWDTETIELRVNGALDHPSAKKRKDAKAYLVNWLERDYERVRQNGKHQGHTNGAAPKSGTASQSDLAASWAREIAKGRSPS